MTLCAAIAPALSAQAQNKTNTLPEVRVTAAPFSGSENEQILTPARVLSGDQLRDRMDSSIGETLSQEMGVSSSGFGAAASRPVIRGLEGGRVKILENGMSTSDVSTISNDHAVGLEPSSARQIEILRGPAALLYGSGAIGGLVNVVNDRIPTELQAKPVGEAELRISSADRGKSGMLSVDGAAGAIGLHVDASGLNSSDYKIPGNQIANNPGSSYGTLPQSFNHRTSLGAGASYIQDWGYVGASVSTLSNYYGVPTASGSRIDLNQQRIDIDSLIRNPGTGLESMRIRLAYTDYKHTELSVQNVAQTNFKNKAWESRIEWQHHAIAGWRGRFGLQAEDVDFSALNAGTGAVNTVLPTRSTSVAAFIVEERNFGPVNLSTGLRFENVNRTPSGQRERTFGLASWSGGALWSFVPGYGAGATLSFAQRAPGTEELYSNGPHDATSTYDKGQSGLATESSQNIELTLQKNTGVMRWKANLFRNQIKNFTYGRLTGVMLDEDGAPGGDLKERVFSQANASLYGAEVEASYNMAGDGLSMRAFADMSRGSFDNGGSLPLQPAARVSVEGGFKRGPWRTGVSALHAYAQNRLATFETTPTSGYTRVDARLSYAQKIAGQQWTWFLQARNLLNQEIRFSTSLLKDSAPASGRSVILGVRTRF